MKYLWMLLATALLFGCHGDVCVKGHIDVETVMNYSIWRYTPEGTAVVDHELEVHREYFVCDQRQ